MFNLVIDTKSSRSVGSVYDPETHTSIDFVVATIVT